MKRIQSVFLVAGFGVGMLACASEGVPTPIDEPEPSDVASWTGAGDGFSWSDTANWDRALDGAVTINVADADVVIDDDIEIEAGVVLNVTNAGLVIDVFNLLTNSGEINLTAGNITARNGGWFQNDGSVAGDGLITVQCDDGGSTTGSTGGVEVTVGDCSDNCIDIDFNLPAGTTVTNQFSADFSVSAQNGNATHPNAAIIFDSANPTGDDTDLATPGYGIGNDSDLGGLLIIGENDVDANSDGLVDDPDDEAAGGSITIDFTCAYIVAGLLMIDVEEFGGSKVELFNRGTSVYVANGAQLDDNSVQGLDFTNAPPADQMVITMTGSGAVDNLRICPTH